MKDPVYKMHKKQFKMMYKKPQGDSFTIYKRLLKYGRPYVLIFIIAVLANAAYSAIDAGYIYLLKPLMDDGFVNPDPRYLLWAPVVVIVLFSIRAIANVVGNYAMAWVGRSVVMCFRKEIFEKLMRLPCGFYDKSSSGQLLAMIVYNAAQVASACTDALTKLIQSGCLVIGLIVVMFSISWHLSLAFFVLIPIVAVLIKISSFHLRRHNRLAQETMAEMTHCAEESIEGYKVIRTFGGEQYEMNKFNDVTDRNRAREMKIILTKSLGVSAVQMVGVSGLAFIIYMGTSAAMSDALTPGGFIAVMAAMLALFKPMKDLTAVNSTIQRGLAGAESVFNLLDVDIEKDTGTKQLARASGEIEFKNVSFAYNEEQPVLTNVSFKAKAGQTIAIVGRSGSGKTTLVNLLPRFYDLTAGEIIIDGDEIRDISLTSLREQYAMVSQHVNLFNDSVGNNIAYGKLGQDVTEQELLSAATAAHAMEFIKDLPEGLDTLVGENGVLLSGGQRQRLAIARAILKDAPILILDEATSALDTESERHIQAALEAVMENRTTFVIAHRLSTIENADLILVLDQGEIVEMGDHTTLIAKKGAYANLHRMQFADHHYSAKEEVNA